MVLPRDDNGNGFVRARFNTHEEYTKGNLINTLLDLDYDGWGEFIMEDVLVGVFLIYEAYADSEYQQVYEYEQSYNVFDLNHDGQMEMVKILADSGKQLWLVVM